MTDIFKINKSTAQARLPSSRCRWPRTSPPFPWSTTPEQQTRAVALAEVAWPSSVVVVNEEALSEVEEAHSKE